MEGRLLLVDDEVAVLDILSDYFVAQGYDVETATNGEEALTRLRAADPDIAVIMVTAELELLLAVAVQLGDLDTTARDAVGIAVGAARRTLPAA